ncbi:hypothetical protein NQZ68_035590 [Dissostichus eleginoides]|nr:hypothetical protein NQZ68_035590 [Dissostichus eleginoides]
MTADDSQEQKCLIDCEMTSGRTQHWQNKEAKPYFSMFPILFTYLSDRRKEGGEGDLFRYLFPYLSSYPCTEGM